ncbi:ABC transporter [Methanosarcina horonobensis HB-1 = JCM 15518]|uniref:ABC transporter n=2 Tax=Methanosarcina horonobensis TaxID=418008 RepID=A0A0E3SEZ0_9EURY|nr:ABC transporter ATP-binding protein [Methanosarcina horonobensis]AKB79596.1 ABC transporter [Methanosarcina horonobensis HB-1 = JCM 15518]
MTAIKVEHLHKTFRIPHQKRTTIFETLTGAFKPPTYETFHALTDINFIVEEGEALGIIGENGSGKSTLLKIIANILRPSAGSVTALKKLTPFLELGVGFQSDLTASENIKIYATIMGMQKKEINDKMDDILKFAGLENFRDTKLKNFSSGMQVRLAFSTAIQTDPEILLMDEVLAVGDMEFQQKCLDVLNEYRKKGITIVFVSHDLGAVRRFCDKVLLLNKGKQVAIGDPTEVIDKYVYAKVETSSSKNDEPESGENKVQNDQHGLTSHQITEKIAEIVDVKFYDKFDHANTNFNSLDPMKVRIFYNSKESIEDPVFGIALYSERGKHLFGTNTFLKNYPINSISGNGYIDLLIEKVPLQTGKFLMTVDLVQSKNYVPLDHKDKQYSFSIIPTGYEEGVLGLSCTWELSSERAA